MDEAKLNYSLRGTLRNEASGMPLAGLKVRAYDRDFFRDQLLGGGLTDENGRYEMRFSRDDFSGPILRLERHPDLFIVVLDAEASVAARGVAG